MDDAETTLGTPAYGYFAGGAGDEITLRDNTESWNRFALRPRMLVDVSTRDPRTILLGVERPHPILVAPMAFQPEAHSDGESGMARAAAATNSTMILSSQTMTGPADVAAAAPDANLWMQLYVFKDRQVSYDLVAAAREGGYEALVLTVDFPVAGWRERDKKSGFQVSHPVVSNTSSRTMTTDELLARHDPSLTWDSIAEFAELSGMPLLLKGILRPDDAELAVQAGVAGVIVSNHGGRQLDTVLSGADALAPVVEAVAGRIDVLVDGGIRRGWDVVKAMALGADAVLVGRRVLWGLVRGGEAGATNALRQLLDEFDNALALIGCPNAVELDPSYVEPAPWAWRASAAEADT